MAQDKKKKKQPGLIEMGKAIYGAYMGRREPMAETRPPRRPMKIAAAEAAEEKEPVATAPPKKKKKRGGVAGVMDIIKERKRRMAEAAGD